MSNHFTCEPLKEEDVIRQYEQGLPIAAIAKNHRVHVRRIRRTLVSNGIEIRQCTHHLKGNSYHAKCPVDKATLEKLYVEENRSIREIMALTGFANIRYQLIKNNIPLRGYSDHKIGRPSPIQPETWKRIAERQSGSNNWNWRGGVVPESAKYYQSKEWKDLSLACKTRDGFTCQSCHKELEARRLRAHHIVARRHHGADVLANLVTLCNSCHLKVENGTLPLP
jgi:hypothetical protein